MNMIVRGLLSGLLSGPRSSCYIIDHAPGLLHNCDLSLFLLFIYLFSFSNGQPISTEPRNKTDESGNATKAEYSSLSLMFSVRSLSLSCCCRLLDSHWVIAPTLYCARRRSADHYYIHTSMSVGIWILYYS